MVKALGNAELERMFSFASDALSKKRYPLLANTIADCITIQGRGYEPKLYKRAIEMFLAEKPHCHEAPNR